MATALFTSKGGALAIGRELGRGGEGAVFEVPSLGGQVAKLYHHGSHLPDAKKQAKLSFMTSTADPLLLSYVAWPQETLHSSKGGPVIGFLMPKVSGKEPIHMVYSPAHRRQDNPKAAWDFLLFVARNVAAAFETVHDHGHVIGDVNQDSVMVGRDSKVVLIDSDSYQVNAGGTLHLCGVGVAFFTPPELQALPSFTGFARTSNHDNFGLALLIFHLLFGGRHPYSGVPIKSGVGDALEADIKNFSYAYARDAQSRGVAPPPRSIPLSMVPDAMEAMFHQAFTEGGVKGGRPTAKQWVAALDSLRSHLKRCSASSVHLYPDHLLKCPWCALEQQGVAYFINMGATYTPTSSGFVLAQVWALIEAVPVPPALSVPKPSDHATTAQALPAGVPSQGLITLYRVLAVGIGITIAVGVGSSGAVFWGLITGVVGWFIAGGVGSTERDAERARRASLEQAAKQEYAQLVERATREAGPDGFLAKRAELAKLRDEYAALPAAEKAEIDKLHATAEERQKQKFLDTFFIDRAEISGVGPTRKAALRSFGIETAADVTANKVKQVRGFGDSLTRAVTDWKASCARRFVFRADMAVSAAERDAVRAKFGARKVAIESALSRGVNELRDFSTRATSQMATLKPRLVEAAKKLAQAQQDLSAL
jgi:DNA-binding helix-hairpin-helix protein with protein kinase domain